ncbi:MAG: BofC C-terminal domain-containing protein [Clostridia bacterium]
MKKTWIISLIIIVIMIGIVTGIILYNTKQKDKNDNNMIENEINKISEKVTDDCINEYIDEIETNSNEEKISPNCLLILKRYYDECQHTINEYVDIPQDLVNGTEYDLKKEYPYWEIEKFSSTEIVLYKEFNSNCGQHFILKEDNGKITVYKINENSEEEVYEKTEISLEYLSETDKIKIKDGIKVNGIEELNQLLEDFE